MIRHDLARFGRVLNVATKADFMLFVSNREEKIPEIDKHEIKKI